MSHTHRLGEELEVLKDELSKLAGDKITAAMSASRERIDEAAKLLGGLLDDLEEVVAREEEDIEAFIRSRPIASVAVAFVAGIGIGLMLRRR